MRVCGGLVCCGRKHGKETNERKGKGRRVGTSRAASHPNEQESVRRRKQEQRRQNGKTSKQNTQQRNATQRNGKKEPTVVRISSDGGDLTVDDEGTEITILLGAHGLDREYGSRRVESVFRVFIPSEDVARCSFRLLHFTGPQRRFLDGLFLRGGRGGLGGVRRDKEEREGKKNRRRRRSLPHRVDDHHCRIFCHIVSVDSHRRRMWRSLFFDTSAIAETAEGRLSEILWLFFFVFVGSK